MTEEETQTINAEGKAGSEESKKQGSEDKEKQPIEGNEGTGTFNADGETEK